MAMTVHFVAFRHAGSSHCLQLYYTDGRVGVKTIFKIKLTNLKYIP